MAIPNETMLTVILTALGVYFSVLLFRGMRGYLLFRKMRPFALLTWRPRPPAHFRMMQVLGVASTAVTLLNSYLDRPFAHVASQGLMAVYFVLMVPLASNIPLGLYRDGVWASTGFLPYQRIGRMAFRESPEIVLVLLTRERAEPFVLPVPPEEYGAVRKVLEEKIREHVVTPEKAILDL
jgi:hypothetical protein